jgi:hypothetical protein
MEQENLNGNQGERIEPKIRVSRDGKWVIIRVPGVEQPIIKSVNYIKAILENAEKKSSNAAVNVEHIKGREEK